MMGSAGALGLGEHTAYLSDTHLLALLEMGLEATLRALKDSRSTPSDETPINHLATWLMRHNPKHSKEGQLLLEKFANELGARAPLADVGELEERQEMDAAVKLQAAARGHTARLVAGEQKTKKYGAAAATVQARVRGRAARKEVEVMHEQDAAATQLQAHLRGQAERKALEKRRVQEHAAQNAAATAVQAAIRGRRVRSAPPGAREFAEEG